MRDSLSVCVCVCDLYSNSLRECSIKVMNKHSSSNVTRMFIQKNVLKTFNIKPIFMVCSLNVFSNSFF